MIGTHLCGAQGLFWMGMGYVAGVSWTSPHRQTLTPISKDPLQIVNDGQWIHTTVLVLPIFDSGGFEGVNVR